MGNLFSYSGIAAKTRAMKSNLIKESEYKELALMSSVPEVIAYLKKHPSYGDILSPYDETRLHRGQAEGLLILSLERDFEKLYHFANFEQRKFLDLYFIRYEVNTLKSLLRKMLNQTKDSKIPPVSTEFLKKYSKINMEKISSSGSIHEFIMGLQGTPYYFPLKQVSEYSSQTLFDYELALDLYYFSSFWKRKDKLLKGKDQKNISDIYGRKFDLLNIQWIYRCKKYYHMSDADIYALIIPIYYKLTRTQIKALVESSTMEEFKNFIQTTYYGRWKEETEGYSVEDMYQKLMNELHTSISRNNPYSMVVITSYLHFKELEIDRLTTALECIRYGLSPNETINYIIKQV